MNHCVPDFEMDEEDYSIPNYSSSAARQKKSAMGEEDIMELLWQNGQVVMQSQNQRSIKKSGAGGSGGGVAEIPADQHLDTAVREIRSTEHETASHQHQHHQQQLFMQEDEMASWLQYPLEESSFDRDIYSDLLFPPPTPAISAAAMPVEARTIITAEIRPLTPPPPTALASSSVASRPPIPPPCKRTDFEAPPRFQNFIHFSRMPRPRVEPDGTSSLSKAGAAAGAAGDSTVVESNETPTVAPESRVSRGADSTAQASGGNVGCATTTGTAAVSTSTAARDLVMTCDTTVSSSPGGSGASVSASAEPPSSNKPITAVPEDRKRKGREADDTECHSEDIDFESADGKKKARGSTSTKRSRAAEVHNLSERRRRDRINEKMRALQELIPRCNKSDKASMLDEAIEYLKSLQLQVQMMSMGCGMLPMMYPGVQQYMPAMGMGMGMGMGMNRPMMPYPPLIPGPGMPNPATAANMGPRFPVPAFHMQPVPVPDPSRIQPPSQSDPMLNTLIAHNPNQPRMPNFVDPYQQFIAIHQAQMSIPQSQVVLQPITKSREGGNPEDHQKG